MPQFFPNDAPVIPVKFATPVIPSAEKPLPGVWRAFIRNQGGVRSVRDWWLNPDGTGMQIRRMNGYVVETLPFVWRQRDGFLRTDFGLGRVRTFRFERVSEDTFDLFVREGDSMPKGLPIPYRFERQR